MNLFCLVGHVVALPELKETSSGTKVGHVKLKVQRPFANSEGVYESDYIQVEIWRGLAETICTKVNVDDLLAIKGRISSHQVEKDGKTYFNYSFIAEKVDFLHN